MKVIFTGGGTGGHIYPALALIKELKNRYHTIDILYIGSEDGLESNIIPSNDITFKSLDVQGFYRKLTSKNITTITKFIKATSKAKKMIRQFQPDLVIGMGGYVSAPVVYAANRLKIPTIIHEQNTMPGLTNRFLGRFADKIAISMEIKEGIYKKQKVVMTGNPRATEVVKEPYKNKKELGFEDKPLILVFGGSRGAENINKSIIDNIKELENKKYQTVYITGNTHYEEIYTQIRDLDLKNVIVKPYIDNMPQIYKIIDLIVCRAGATTLSEITALGIPAILIPSPYVTANHQEVNARVLVKNNAAKLVLEKELKNNYLIQVIDDIMNNKELRINMKINSAKLGLPNAADDFIRLIMEVSS